MVRIKTSSLGFTLVELIVVIVIISIMTAFVSVNFIGIRQRGRDAQRKSDLRQVQAALELYRSDVGCYPSVDCDSTFVFNCGATFTHNGITYLQKIPCDPSSDENYYGYEYIEGADEFSYELSACIENTGDTDINISESAPGTQGCPSGKFFQLQNP